MYISSLTNIVVVVEANERINIMIVT